MYKRQVFIYTKLGGDSVTAFYAISVLIGFAVGYSGAWGAYYTELFPSKYRALSSGMSFNGCLLYTSWEQQKENWLMTTLPDFTEYLTDVRMFEGLVLRPWN